ncbi:MAG: hypothetical protein ABWZ40_04950, partial [Caulobacterales bacterium]
MQAQAQWPVEYAKIWRNVWQRSADHDIEPHLKTASSDRRFRSDSWNNYPAFDLIKQTYLLIGQQLQSLVQDA